MEDLNKELGERVELQRKISRQTRKQLGDKIGVCYQQVQNYELGKHRMTVERLFDISKALKVRFLRLLPDELTEKK
jgi:transcriptional regulator with XRE-family HTH domain